MALNTSSDNLPGETQQGRNQTDLSQQEIQAILSTVGTVQSYISQEYLTGLNLLDLVDKDSSRYPHVRAHRVDKFMYDRHEDVSEKMAGVYTALYNINSSFAMVIQGTPDEGTSVYLCTNATGNIRGDAQKLLERSVKGNFPGTDLLEKETEDRSGVQKLPPAFFFDGSGYGSRSIYSASLYPGRRSGEEHMMHGSNLTVQGMEKLIDTMKGLEYTMIILSVPVTVDTIEQRLAGLRQLYSVLSAYAKESIAMNESLSKAMASSVTKNSSSSLSAGISRSYGTNHSRSTGGSAGASSGSSVSFLGVNYNSGSQSSSSWGEVSGDNSSNAQTQAKVQTDSSGRTTGITVTSGIGRTMTYTRENKQFSDLLKKIEQQIQHLERDRVQGMWDTCCYVIAPQTGNMAGAEIATIAISAYVSLVSGENAISEHCHINSWTDGSQVEKLTESLRCLEHPVFRSSSISDVIEITPALTISSHELVIMASLPRRSINGLQVDSMAEFGRSFPSNWKSKKEPKFDFGWIYHMGEEEPNAPLTFMLQTFASHVFLTGASGSGKSNTAWHLIRNLKSLDVQDNSGDNVKVMIIEPVKGEYKRAFGPELQVYCAHPKQHRQLRINPFEFSEDVDISEHLSALCDILSACWPLYGPMPGILREAIERCYLSCGWDLSISRRVFVRNKKFPNFHTLLRELNNVLNESSYSKQTKGDYIGAMTMRVQSLVTGFEGQIFCSDTYLSDSDLFENNVLIDLSSIASTETRALVMGVLVMRLKEYRHNTASGNNAPLRHVTVLEEAHTLLKRCSLDKQQDSSNIQAASVQMISEAIAEMRSYGEGFIIVDQSPTAVDVSAIKNTAIKIVMRLPEKRDCEDIGNALSLNEEQIHELSRLKRGVAAVYHDGWDRTVLAKMGDIFVPDKKYNPAIVSYEDMIKLRGLAVSVIIAQRKAFLDNHRDYQEMMKIEQKVKILFKRKPFRNIQKEKQDEILQSLQRLQVSIGNLQNKGDVNTALNRLDELIGFFLIDFLQLRSLLRMLPIPSHLSSQPWDERYARKVDQWRQHIMSAMSNYLYLYSTEDAARLPQAKVPEIMENIVIWVLQGYAKEQADMGADEYGEFLTRLRMRC